MQKVWRGIGGAMFWVLWPVLFLYLRWSARTRVLVVAGGEQVLLARGLLGDGRWSLPGGGLHRGEDHLSGALRELREETGLKLAAEQLTLLASTVYRDHGLQFTCHYLLAEISEVQPVHRRFPEVLALKWMDYRSVKPAIVDRAVTEALELWLDKRNLVQ